MLNKQWLVGPLCSHWGLLILWEAVRKTESPCWRRELRGAGPDLPKSQGQEPSREPDSAPSGAEETEACQGHRDQGPSPSCWCCHSYLGYLGTWGDRGELDLLKLMLASGLIQLQAEGCPGGTSREHWSRKTSGILHSVYSAEDETGSRGGRWLVQSHTVSEPQTRKQSLGLLSNITFPPP